MSHRTAGTQPCTVAGCRVVINVQVEGGDAEFRREAERQLGQHHRAAHPWMFVEFTVVDAAGDGTLLACDRCGAIVADAAVHKPWHQGTQA